MPKSVDPVQKREEFIAASCHVIAGQGLKAATLRSVAAEAGCTTGSLTHYYSDRQSLLVDSLRSVHFRAGERMREVAEGAASPAARLHAVLLESLPVDEERLGEWRIWLAFWAESMNDDLLSKENDRRNDEWQAVLVNLVSALLSDRRQAKSEATRLYALVDGLGLQLARVSKGLGKDRKVASLQRECKATLIHHLESAGLV